MKRRLLRVLVLTGVAAAQPSIAQAQFPPPPAPAATVQDRWPQPAPPPTQRQPVPQQQQQQPPRQAQPAPQADPDAPRSAPRPAPRPRAAAGNVVTCGGVFVKDTTHLKLAIKYDSRNIVFGEVDGPDGTRIKATILYPNEPKRRLEVIWNNDAARTDLSLVVINGQSQWTAPKGLKIGIPLATLEKINGRPFKLGAVGADGSASAIGWEGGALTSLPGGCKVGVRMVADAKAPTDGVGAVSAQKEMLSNDASFRALKPKIAEILIGY